MGVTEDALDDAVWAAVCITIDQPAQPTITAAEPLRRAACPFANTSLIVERHQVPERSGLSVTQLRQCGACSGPKSSLAHVQSYRVCFVNLTKHTRYWHPPVQTASVGVAGHLVDRLEETAGIGQ